MILLVVMIGLVVGPLLGGTIAANFYDGDFIRDLQNFALKPDAFDAILILQGTGTLVSLILFPIIYITQLEHKSLRPFFPVQANLPTILLVVALLGVVFPIALSPIMVWNMNVKFPEILQGFEEWAIEKEELGAKLTEQMTNFSSLGKMFAGIFVIGLLPAIGEELVFRGLLQREIWRASLKIHLAIWLSAAIFSTIHFQFFGFIPRLLLGALFGYLYYWSGNLLIPIFSHFVNNAFIVVMVYLNQTKITTIDIEGNEVPPAKFVIACALLSIGLIYYIWHHYTKVDPPVERVDNSYTGNSPLA
ncbi:MAG TPA: CPBP family intramembrane glutamic endopeptidase [Chryseolinea sp.]|nr:CPBP family intramembrane glutamic endopeptidase [Chryseolinea sp.]